MNKNLQILRFIFFLCIFSFHLSGYFNINIPVVFSIIAVDFFFMLSGFLIYKNLNNQNYQVTLKMLFERTFLKIKKIYPVYFIMFVLSIPFVIHRFSSNLLELILIAISNLLMIQSWIPLGKFIASFNPVSWFISTYLFLYFLSPILTKIVKKYNNVFLFLICFFTMSVFYKMGGYWNYNFPIYRLCCFIIGMIVCKFTLQNKLNYTKIHKGCSLLILISLIFFSERINSGMYSIVFVLPLSYLIYSFYYSDNNFESNIIYDILYQLGNKTLYYFMNHFIVIWIVIFIMKKIYPTCNGIIIYVMCLILTIIFGKLLYIMDKKWKGRLYEKN